MCCQRHHLGHRGQRHGARRSGSAGTALAAEMARELPGRGDPPLILDIFSMAISGSDSLEVPYLRREGYVREYP